MINILGVAKDIRPCPRCGCYTMEYRSMGPHIGKYCKNCTKWIKWVSRKDMPEEIAARVTDTTENLYETHTPIDIEEDDLPWY